jgi:hypothetical protein
MDWDGAIRFAQGVGFPALVAGFVLVRLDSTMKDLIKAVVELKESILLARRD